MIGRAAGGPILNTSAVSLVIAAGVAGLVAAPSSFAEDSTERLLAPWIGVWGGGTLEREAHPFLAITSITDAADGVWAETNARSRLNMGDWIPVRVQFTHDEETNRYHARVGGKSSRGVHYVLGGDDEDGLLWEEAGDHQERATRHRDQLPM